MPLHPPSTCCCISPWFPSLHRVSTTDKAHKNSIWTHPIPIPIPIPSQPPKNHHPQIPPNHTPNPPNLPPSKPFFGTKSNRTEAITSSVVHHLTSLVEVHKYLSYFLYEGGPSQLLRYYEDLPCMKTLWFADMHTKIECKSLKQSILNSSPREQPSCYRDLQILIPFMLHSVLHSMFHMGFTHCFIYASPTVSHMLH